VRLLRLPLTTRPRRQQADVIVVLGAALGPDGDLGPALAERVAAGAAAFRAGAAPWMMMTGAREASKMRARAIVLGVPGEQILIEHQALTTRDNATLCAALMRARGLERALVVTQPYHRRRSVASFRRVGVAADALGFSAERETLRGVLREYVALAVYAWRGWI
jgi:uncharacterized SAM-binding protein YcdF (DUF218 family)